MRGILIIGVAQPQYVWYALNCAVSVKTYNPDAHITLITDRPDALQPNERIFFDEIKVIEPGDYLVNGKSEPAVLKCKMFDLSPYEKTIYLDADSLWLPGKKVSQLFDECTSSVSFQCIHEHDLSKEWKCLWTAREINGKSVNTGLEDIRRLYNREKGRIYEMQSSFMYFDKSKRAKSFFDAALEFYVSRPIPFHTWGSGMPDELAFNAATAKIRFKLKTFPFTPVYFADYDMNKYLMGANREGIFRDYYVLSMAGNANPKRTVDLYNDVLTKCYAMNQTRIRFPRKWTNKRQFDRTRLHL